MANETKMAVLLEARIRDFERKLNQATRSADRSMKKIEKRNQQMVRRLNSDFAGIGSGLQRALGAAGLGIGASSLIAGVRDTIKELSAMQKVIDRVGLSAEVFQQLQFGFELAGIGAAEFNTGMERFADNIGTAATQGGRLADVLKANGVALRDSNGALRSQESLLRDYADLVKNAASDQERMVLATEAFGSRAGRAFVNGLVNGSEGLDKMAEDAGETISRELIDRAAEFDDRWAMSWRSFTVLAKSSILEVLPHLETMNDKAGSILSNLPVVLLADYLFSDAPETVDAIQQEIERLERRLEVLHKSVEKNTELGISTARFDRLIEEATAKLAALRGQAAGLSETAGAAVRPGDPDAFKDLPPATPPKPPRTTILPPPPSGGGSGGGRNAAAEAALREAEAVQRVIDGLTHELSLVGASDVERAKANALRQAGAAATAEQRQQIESLTVALHEEEAAFENAARAAEELGDLGRDAMRGLIDDLIAGKDAGEALAGVLSKIGSKLIDMALGGLFGGGGGGLLGGLFGFADGGFVSGKRPKPIGFDKGGYTGPGGKYQPAGVVHKGEYVFSKDAVDRIGVGNLEAMHRNLKGYAEGGFVAPSVPKLKQAAPPSAATSTTIVVDVRGAKGNAEIEEMVSRGISKGFKEYDKGTVGRVARATGEARRRGML